jgi:uncharacterized protein with GYD domain
MTTYLVHARYSPAAFQGMLADSLDRGQAAKVLFKSLGLKTKEIMYSVTSGEIVCLVEGTSAQIAQAQMITMASGGFSQVDAQELMTTQDMQAAMKTAASKVSKYSAPNKK